MPVRLADIPNAPKLGPEFGMTETPGLRSDFGGLAGQLRQEELPKGYFDGNAQGVAKMAEAIGGTSEVFGKLAKAVESVTNNLTVNKAHGQIDDYIAARRGEMAQMPEDQWLGHLLEGIPKLEKSLQGLRPSDTARREINEALMWKVDRARVEVVGEARNQLATNALGMLEAQVSRTTESGDYRGALTVVDRGVRDQVITAEEGERRKQGILAGAEQTKVGEMMVADPQAFLTQVEEKGGVEIAGYGMVAFEGERKARVMQQARRVLVEQRTSANGELDELVQGGRLGGEAEVRAWALAKRLPERDVASHVAALAVVDDETPEGQARVLRSRLEIGAGLAQVNVKDVDKKFAYQDRIRRELPLEERGDWQKLVKERYGGAQTNPIEAELQRRNVELMQAGFYGRLRNEPGEEAARQNLSILQRAEASRQAVEKLIRMEPNLTKKEAYGFFYESTAGAVHRGVRERTVMEQIGFGNRERSE